MASSTRLRSAVWSFGLAGLAAMSIAAQAAPSILVDVASGDVLDQKDATRSWFPASTTKLMTVYVALDAVAAGRISLNTPMLVSPRALSMAPSKMGFAAGTQVTLDNALKMLMVKSANDIAVTIAEGVSGSVEAFAGEMNAAAARIGMRESRFFNPNGLPDPRQVSSARDLAVLARALMQRFPDHGDLFGIGAMRLGGQIIPTHNGLLGRYPGADGMKTGFTCAAGFNMVATATQGSRRLIAVVLGAPSATARNTKAASLLNKGFAGRGSNAGSLTALATNGVTEAPDMHGGVCRNRGKAQAQYMAEIEDTAIPLTTDYTATAGAQPERSFLTFGSVGAPQEVLGARQIVAMPRPLFSPVDVFVGPMQGWTGTVAHANDYSGPPATTATAFAPDKTVDTPLKASDDALPMRRGKRATAAKPAAATKVAHAVAEPDAAAEPKAKGGKHAVKPAKAARPAAKVAAKSEAKAAASSDDDTAAGPASPKVKLRKATAKPAPAKPGAKTAALAKPHPAKPTPAKPAAKAKPKADAAE